MHRLTDKALMAEHGHLLTVKEHAVIELYVRGLSQRSIALALDISRSSVQSRLETATRKFRIATKGAA